MNDIKKLLGKRIKTLRQKQNISQQKLAELVGIDQRSLSHIECGDTFPSRALLNIANALNVQLEELFDFNYLSVDEKSMKNYITQNIDFLSGESLVFLYRIFKILR